MAFRPLLPRRPIRQFRGQDTYDVLSDVTEVMNQGISYGDGVRSLHMAGVFAKIADSGLANTPFTVNHTLGRIPIGFHVMRKTSAGEIFDSGVAWTNKTISIVSPTAHVLNILLFIF